MDEDAPDVRTWAYGYGFSYVNRRRVALEAPPREPPRGPSRMVGRGDDAVGNPHRAQIVQFQLFESILLLKLAKQFPVERFEAEVSEQTVPSPPLAVARCLVGVAERHGREGPGPAAPRRAARRGILTIPCYTIL